MAFSSRWLLLALLPMLPGCGSPQETKPAPRVELPLTWGNFPAPEIEGKDDTGQPMKLSDFRGKVVVLHFWAGWCDPCMLMVPHERALVVALKQRPFVMLGVNADRKREDMTKTIADKAINWRSWWDEDGQIQQLWKVEGLPTLFVLDAEGIVRYRFVGLGPETMPQMDAVILELLKNVPAPTNPPAGS